MEEPEFKANLWELNKHFECRIDPKHAGGYAYFCRKCGKECNCMEAEFECQDGNIIPLYVICRFGCGARWRLKLEAKIESLH